MKHDNRGPVEYSSAVVSEFTKGAQPILDALNLTHFIYINILDDHKRLYLSNDHDWIENYINHSLHEDLKHEEAAIVPGNRSRYAFWNSYEEDRVFNACHAFGMWNGFIVYDGNEIFSFATKRENENVANYYLKNCNLIERFITFFKNKCHDIIDISDEKKLIHSNKIQTSVVNDEEQEALDAFMKSTMVDTFKIIPNKALPTKDCFFRYREAEVLFHISRGKTMKEAAFSINLSPRTVEKYLENAKSRLQCFSKSELLEIFLKNHLDSYFSDSKGLIGF